MTYRLYTLVGVNQFSSITIEEFALGAHGNITDVQSQIENIDDQMRSGTILDPCLRKTLTDGGRPNQEFPKFSVTVTDGVFSDGTEIDTTFLTFG
eukprot:TRINITY_DN5613_c0_g1_i1.p2 TRINITY_DN5613_c0_g1~~TRINITY_DN5613_c0_g1_i1.p2  ORF type:complete len:95 (+),score=22.87 TRINITY_DN5613_c0_g1_i1:164-448(+)